MNQQYCIFIALGIWLEALLNAYPWAATSLYVFSFKNHHRIPDGAIKSIAHAQRALHVVFNGHDDFSDTKLGSHSVQKFASTTVQKLGATKDEKDLRVSRMSMTMSNFPSRTQNLQACCVLVGLFAMKLCQAQVLRGHL
jgi:hypothetical protein